MSDQTDVKELLGKVADSDVRSQLEAVFGELSGSSLRQQVTTLQDENKTLKQDKRSRAFKDAGFDPESGPGKALAKLYDGEADPTAIQTFAKDEFGFEPNGVTAPPDPAAERAAGEDRLSQLNAGTIPTRDPSPEDDFQAALAEGDTATAGRINAQKLAKARAS
jgi:hypothetical protein